jgi:hypothetical protein
VSIRFVRLLIGLQTELYDGVGHTNGTFRMGAIIDSMMSITVCIKSYCVTYLKFI